MHPTLSPRRAPALVRALFAALLAVGTAAPAAAAFDAVYAFGDSLSDNGNAFALTGAPPAPYFDGRFSNGPVAVERLASNLGVPLFDFAVGGATTGLYNADAPTSPTGVKGQLLGFEAGLGGSPADSHGLYVVWAGANDLLPPADAASAYQPAIDNLVSTVTALYHDGARKFLVPLLPDLGLTPALSALGPVAAGQASFISEVFNANLAANLFLLEGSLSGARISVFDTFAFEHSVLGDPTPYGITNTTDACFDGTSVCADPSKYLFWDDLHPTAVVHQVIGDRFTAEVTAVPEPSTVALMVAGLGVIGGAVRRRRAAAQP